MTRCGRRSQRPQRNHQGESACTTLSTGPLQSPGRSCKNTRTSGYQALGGPAIAHSRLGRHRTGHPCLDPHQCEMGHGSNDRDDQIPGCLRNSDFEDAGLGRDGVPQVQNSKLENSNTGADSAQVVLQVSNLDGGILPQLAWAILNVFTGGWMRRLSYQHDGAEEGC